MNTKYWGSFRIAEKIIGNRTADQRRSDLYQSIANRSSAWWVEPTSFLLFESASTIDQIMAGAYRAIAPSVDLFIVRELDVKTARVIGHVDDPQMLGSFMPYIKRWAPSPTR